MSSGNGSLFAESPKDAAIGVSSETFTNHGERLLRCQATRYHFTKTKEPAQPTSSLQ